MPTSARVAIAIFMPWRTFHCVLWTKSRVISGCLTCTAMNRVPAATAARPAARVSFVVVICMTASVGCGRPRRVPGDWSETYEAAG